MSPSGKSTMGSGFRRNDEEHIMAVRPLRLSVPLVVLLLAACAPPPIYKSDSTFINATPAQVAATPEHFQNAQVIWGGRVIGVRNFPDHSEVEILDYPLDSSQRPRVKEPGGGRFIALMPGYVESMDYPSGSLMTLRGTLDGARQGKVGDADYVFPLVRVAQSHRWTPQEMDQGHPHI